MISMQKFRSVFLVILSIQGLRFESILSSTNTNIAEKEMSTNLTNHHHHNPHVHHLKFKNQNEPSVDPNQQIFINQSNNIYILAKYGQTVSLPCIIYRQRNQDLSNIHTIWHKLSDRQRPIVLSVGLQQLKQDMRYRIKSINLNRVKLLSNSQTINGDNEDNEIQKSKTEPLEHQIAPNEEHLLNDLNSLNEHLSHTPSIPIKKNTPNNQNKYLIQNWQLEIRKLTYDDAGTYQCLLPLVKPLTKNITLQVIPDLTIEPREANYKIDDKIVIKCKATLRYQPKSSHHLNQRQQRPNIHWYKENEMIKSSVNTRGTGSRHAEQKIEIDTRQDQTENQLNSVLTIYNAKVDDSGKYRCIYDNIQEQVNVKVIYDYYEYKNYLSADATSSTNRVKTSLVWILLVIFSFVKLNLFVFYS